MHAAQRLPRVRAARPDPQRLAQQIGEIDRLNSELSGITLLKGIEVDILEDGRLDPPDSILSKLDLVVGAVHGSRGWMEEKDVLTARPLAQLRRLLSRARAAAGEAAVPG